MVNSLIVADINERVRLEVIMDGLSANRNHLFREFDWSAQMRYGECASEIMSEIEEAEDNLLLIELRVNWIHQWIISHHESVAETFLLMRENICS